MQNLLNRGLSEERIGENRYRSMPADWQTRKQIANTLSKSYDLRGVPEFFTRDNQCNLCGKGGIIDPVCSRDNDKGGDIVRRELIKETLDSSTNHYTKLANIWFDKTTGDMGYDNVEYDIYVNPYTYCDQAVTLFEKYKRCAGRKHIETIANGFLEKMQAVKCNVHGRILYLYWQGNRTL